MSCERCRRDQSTRDLPVARTLAQTSLPSPGAPLIPRPRLSVAGGAGGTAGPVFFRSTGTYRYPSGVPSTPRVPPGPRACIECGREFVPQVSRRGGQPTKRCPACRPSVTPIRPSGTADAADPLAELLEQARQACRVSMPVRERLLAVTHLLAADPDLVGNRTVAACAAELRALCGFAGTAGTHAEMRSSSDDGERVG
jgi:hypothetical protein